MLSAAAAAAQASRRPAGGGARPGAAAGGPASWRRPAPRRVGYLAPGTAPDMRARARAAAGRGRQPRRRGPDRVPQHSPPPGHAALGDGAARQRARHSGAAAGVQLRARQRRSRRPTRRRSCGCSRNRISTPADRPSWARTRGAASGPTSAKRVQCACRPKRSNGWREAARTIRPATPPPAGWRGACWPRWHPIAPREILERARMFGESRVVCGVHHVTAVEAGRPPPRACWRRCTACRRSAADLDAAREEVSRLRGKAKPSADACAADAAALSERPVLIAAKTLGAGCSRPPGRLKAAPYLLNASRAPRPTKIAPVALAQPPRARRVTAQPRAQRRRAEHQHQAPQRAVDDEHGTEEQERGNAPRARVGRDELRQERQEEQRHLGVQHVGQQRRAVDVPRGLVRRPASMPRPFGRARRSSSILTPR